MEWILFPIISAPMPFHMALDEILFRPHEFGAENMFPELQEKPILRLYYSSEPWITIGYSMDKPVTELKQLPFCRRLTGGGEVLHGKDILFTITGGKMQDESFHSVRISYWKIHEAVKAGFSTMGLHLDFYRCDEKLPRGNQCFRYPISSDLSLNGKKIAGGAQKRSTDRFLHQESIQWSDRRPAKLEDALVAGFENIFSVRFHRWPLKPEILKLAAEVEKQNYAVCTGVLT